MKKKKQSLLEQGARIGIIIVVAIVTIYVILIGIGLLLGLMGMSINVLSEIIPGV